MGSPVNIGGPEALDVLAAVTRGIRTKWFSDKLKKFFKVADGSRAEKVISAFTGHPRGNTVEEKDPLGRVTRRAYDAQNELVRVVDPAGGAWRIERDRNGNPIHVANPAGALSRYAFDDRGRPTELEDPSGRRVRLGWSDRSDLESLTIGATGSGRTTSFEHDSQGRLVASLDAGGRTSRAVHDAAGRVTHIEQPDGERLVLAYDPEGNVVEQVDALGRRVSLRYAGLNRLVEQTDPMNFKVRLAYDTEEDLVAVENPIGERYRFEVDRAGRLSREIGFDGVRTSYLRDKAGQLVKVLGPDHKAISLERDALGRIVRQAFADGEERYAFDLLGSLVAIDAPAGRTSFARDALGRMLGERHEPAGADSAHEVSSHYDASGLRLERETTLGHRATYAWDDAWQLTGISAGPSRALQQPELRRLGLPSLLAPDWLMRIERDPLGLELARVLPGAVRSAWARDGFGRPERQTVTGPAARTRGGAVPARPSDTLLDVRYQWRGADQIAALVDARTGATTRYEHDPRGHLVRTLLADGRVEHRASDAVGNLFRTPDGSDRVYGPGGRLERVGATELRYDARGNLVEKRLADGARWTYRWTHSGTLAEVARPDGTRVEFMYDALGRRLTKSADGTTTEYVWDGDDLVHERRRVTREGEVQPLITWIFEPGTFAPVAKIVGRKRYAVVCDHLGTPSALFTEDGRLAWRGELDTWGRLQERREGIAPEDWTDNPWRYPGQYEDAETGLYYNRHRYFDPELGRYISQDPIGLLGGTALYSYVRDPLGWLDPDGLKPCGFDQEAKAKLLASKPVGMLNAHRHHIVMEGLFSGWSAANRKFVTGAQDLLKDLGIKIQGKFNAAWAKNAGHSVEYAKKVFEDLTKAAASKAGKAAKAKAVTDKLEEIGKLLGTGGY